MAWQLDINHSLVSFTVRHMMISKVRGEFPKFEGTFNIDENDPTQSSVEVKIDAASINTRAADRDKHLRSADFFNAEAFPYLTFKSTGVKVTSERTALLTGDLTIRDVTRPVELEVEFVGAAKSPWGSTSYGFNAHTAINRKDWNLTWNVGLETGGVLVGDEIQIDIELELVKVAETQAANA